MKHVKNFLSPELLNRIDQTIIFKPLSKDTLKLILKQQLTDFLATWKSHHPDLKLPIYNDKKLSDIIEKIYDPQFGARPIARYIHSDIEHEIIDQMMK
jgi:ATP-dependent Clp protease ATP-binding subunit ClpA